MLILLRANFGLHRRGRQGGREGTVKLKQMPEKEPPYVLVLIISTFVGTTATTCASLGGFLSIGRETDFQFLSTLYGWNYNLKNAKVNMRLTKRSTIPSCSALDKCQR